MAKTKLVVMGASAGALEALSTILPGLPADYPLPILVVVHLAPDRESLFPELLQRKCQLRVCEAEDKQLLTAGTVYIAPPDYHVLVEDDGRISLSSEEEVQFSRPSIDVLFETAAEAFGEGVVGVVLTGANSDGARGLRDIMQAGGLCLVQEPDGAYASAMPEAALEHCPQARALPLAQLAPTLMEAGIAC